MSKHAERGFGIGGGGSSNDSSQAGTDSIVTSKGVKNEIPKGKRLLGFMGYMAFMFAKGVAYWASIVGVRGPEIFQDESVKPEEN